MGESLLKPWREYVCGPPSRQCQSRLQPAEDGSSRNPVAGLRWLELDMLGMGAGPN